MKKKASDIIRRALNLADISNTDFLTHEEHTEYLNDAWKSVYQWLINKGDKQFIKEISLGGANFGAITEYDLPNDLYQILSLKDGNSGRIIPRHAESESISSNTYEVVNDKLRLYGVTATNLVLTYYMTPVYITFPDKDIVTDDFVTDNRFIEAYYGNTILYWSREDGDSTTTYTIRNVLTGELISNSEAFSKAVGGFFDDYEHGYAILGDGHVLVHGMSGVGYCTQWFDFNGNDIGRIWKSTTNYGIYNGVAVAQVGTKVYGPTGTTLTDQNVVCEIPTGYLFIGGNNMGIVLWKESDKKLYMYDRDTEEVKLLKDEAYNLYGDAFQKYIPLDNYGFYLVLRTTDWDGHGDVYTVLLRYDEETEQLCEIKEYFGPVGAYLKYGPYVHTGNYVIKSIYEDTVFNFPNELFYSLISADLAMRYAMKQNADFTGLQQLYQSMKDTYMNSLSQDGGYNRIKNIYR